MTRAEATRLWLRFDDEAAACPGCSSSKLVLLDSFTIPRDARRRRVRFLTGCRDCGLLFANPLPTSDQLAAYYGDGGGWVGRRAERRQRLEARHRRRLAAGVRPPAGAGRPRRARPRDRLLEAIAGTVPVFTPPPGAAVLDFGCGDGKLLDCLQDCGWETSGIEPSMDVAFFRHHRLLSPPQDRRFALVILNHVLEHVTDPVGVLRQLAGALREDGTLFLSVPRFDTLPEHGDFQYCINGQTHPLCFTETCLTVLLARAGLADTARLDARELDEAFTEGKPLRLRLLAVPAPHPPVPPDTPLAPAIRALTRYYRGHRAPLERAQRLLPVRLRATLMDRARERVKASA